jgi:hypothetical protein
LTITVAGPDGKAQTLAVPTTAEQVANLQAQREELADQLTSVSSRRTELVAEIQATNEANRAGLQDRLKILDQRILQIESDLAATGRQISSAPAQLVGSTQSSGVSADADFTQGMVAGGFATVIVLSIGYFAARRRWRRRGTALPSDTGADSARLERLEHGMEAIAIEIERVSEGQRFVTRLLSESQAPLGTSHRIAQPVAAEKEQS